jgi:ADP-heptose:LPS heptosyltransferase
MRIVYITEPITLGTPPMGITLKGKSYYVMSDTDYGQFRTILPEKIGASIDFNTKYRRYQGQDLTGKTILAIRTGGIGDLLFMTPAFKYIKETYKDVKTVMCAGVSYNQVMVNNPYIDEVHSMPFPYKLLENSDYHLEFQGIIEENEDARNYNAYDVLLRAFGIDNTKVSNEDKKPIVVLTDTEKRWGLNRLKELKCTDNYKIGIQIESSSPVRTFPTNKMVNMISVLLDENYTVFLFGGGRQHDTLQNLKMRFFTIWICL